MNKRVEKPEKPYLECYSCGTLIKYDGDIPECYCNDCEPYESTQEIQLLKDMLQASDDSLTLAQEEIDWLKKSGCVYSEIAKNNVELAREIARLEKEIDKLKHHNYAIKDMQDWQHKYFDLQAELSRIKGISVESIDRLLEKNWNHLFSPEDNYLGRLLMSEQIHNLIQGGGNGSI